MIDKKVIKRIMGGILRKNKQSMFDRQIMHARRDWYLGLLVGVSLVSYFGFWSYQTYIYYRQLSPNGAVELTSETAYREAMVNTVLEDFATRRNIYESIKADLIIDRRDEVANNKRETERKDQESGEINDSENEVEESSVGSDSPTTPSPEN